MADPTHHFVGGAGKFSLWGSGGRSSLKGDGVWICLANLGPSTGLICLFNNSTSLTGRSFHGAS